VECGVPSYRRGTPGPTYKGRTAAVVEAKTDPAVPTKAASKRVVRSSSRVAVRLVLTTNWVAWTLNTPPKFSLRGEKPPLGALALKPRSARSYYLLWTVSGALYKEPSGLKTLKFLASFDLGGKTTSN